MAHHQPIEDIDEPDITAEHVEKRVEDWLNRLDGLLASIEVWAARNRWTVTRDAAVPMHEPLMMRFALPAREQPALILSPSGGTVWIRPKGLWVVGANGRVDVFSPKGAFVLVDVADQFHSPHWIFHKVGKGDGHPFDPQQIADTV